ncbi:MAG TPA: hypothetical protein VM493_06440 [Vicinamibacterales bacterium]|nr:hypothetical protein [Vicinamibacterales bacterium]
MNCRAASLVLTLSLSALSSSLASAQVVIQPTPNPTVTAENEPWYLSGEPVTHAGNLYYPAGPRVFFNPNEMVRSGFHMGIPLYTRTTIEPYSVVYLPVGPGVLQPYERPRTGALAETSGSIASSLRAMPITSSQGAYGPILQAAGAASQTTTEIPVYVPMPVGTAGTAGGTEPSPVAVAPAQRGPAPVWRPMHTRIGGVPQGSNSIFIEFEGERWYKAGAARAIDTARMARAGTYAGIPVWSEQGTTDGIIYVPVTQQGGSLVVPYSRKR